VGDMDLAKLYRIYKRPYDREIQGHLHNNFFHSLATLGVVGFLAIMFLLIKIFLIHLKLFKKLKNIPFASSFSLGVLGGFVSFIAAGLTEYNIGDHEVITLVWFTLAISMAFSKSIEKEETQMKIS
jgi:O-antigen ligase